MNILPLVWDTVAGYVPGTRYNREKIRARETAQEWQAGFADHNYSYGEIAAFQEMFYRLGKRYGLLTEYRENGII